MRITVFGANGPTGRLLTGRALAAGHRGSAVTSIRTPAPMAVPCSTGCFCPT
ncbi:hypothetical protein WJ438_15240 [Streptomyces sp. GD-15H]|uniref:hypothetical protein n=1 Tax=Streptomyces sp. GD-15H TaxID=3129112 RepID=UPI00324B41F0